MHSRIFHLESSKQLLEDYKLTESSIIFENEWFLNSIADYIDEDTNKESDIKWFIGYIESEVEDKSLFEVTEYNNIVFKKGFKEAYFEKRFEEFKKKASELTLSNFCSNSYDIDLYRIEMLIEDKFGFYIYSEGELVTLDSFMRDLQDEDIKLYFGNTLDYHC